MGGRQIAQVKTCWVRAVRNWMGDFYKHPLSKSKANASASRA